jgi:hypothetical protein
MNKQVFVTEVETNCGQKPASLSEIETGIREGFRECFRDEITLSSIHAANVEQNVERPLDQRKMLDLLVKAKRRLGNCAAYEDGKDNDDLVKKINEFLMEKQ